MALVEFGGREDVEVPVIVCIAPDAVDRRRVLEAVERLGVVVVVAPDSRSARQVLGRVGAFEVPDSERSRQVVIAGDLEIDHDRAEARWRGVAIDMTQRELALLDCMAREPGKVWPFARLHRSVWGSSYLGDRSCLHAAVKRLRVKLHEHGVGVRIDAVRSVGFRLVVPSPPGTPPAAEEQ